jgi:uncharacterized protein
MQKHMIKSYTLITGASKGFGKALALDCARRNMNLILVSLPEPELYETSQWILSMFAVDVICIEIDLCSDEGCAALFGEVNALGLQVNMLINNAGIGSTEWFQCNSPSFYEKQIKLNVLALAHLSRLFLPMLKQNAPAYILNVGSLASFFSLPKKAVYGGTKSFVYSFSNSLRPELKKDNIHVGVVCPGGMLTSDAVRQMVERGSFLLRSSCMEPEEVALATIDGLLRKKEIIVPGNLNRAFLMLDFLLPRFLKKFLVANTMKRLHTTPSFSSNKQLPSVPILPLVAKEKTYAVKLN